MARHQIYNLVCGKCSVAKTRAGDLRRFIKPHLEGRLRKVPAYGVRTSPLAACNLRIDGEDRRRAERRARRFHTSAGRELSAIRLRVSNYKSFSVMILPQVHLRKPCYDFYFL